MRKFKAYLVTAKNRIKIKVATIHACTLVLLAKLKNLAFKLNYIPTQQTYFLSYPPDTLERAEKVVELA